MQAIAVGFQRHQTDYHYQYNMVGRKMLANVDLCCQDIFINNEPFGNVSIMLVGDIRQLPLVFDTPLYTKGGNGMQVIGLVSYSYFDHCIRIHKHLDRQVIPN